MLPSNELRAILNHVTGHYVRLEDCTEEQRIRIDDLIQQRLTGVPLAKIIGYKEFWKHRFTTTKDTLDPRPDSETLIEAVLQICPVRRYRVLDLGTGTGCLLISLLEEYPEATGVGVDISEKALEVARRNAFIIFNKDETRIQGWVQSNWCEQLSGTFDIIVCNPPYIDPTEPINEGAKFDPSLALYGGIHIYTTILQSIDQYLSSRPRYLFFEIGYTQAYAVSELLKQYGYHSTQLFKDLSGHDRVISACSSGKHDHS